MQIVYFHQLVAQHPELLEDRHGLCFSSRTAPAKVVGALSRSGAIMLRDALPPRTLVRCRETFRWFTESLGQEGRKIAVHGGDDELALDDGPSPEWDQGETEHGSWHLPWIVRHLNQSPTAVVLSQLLKSWAWPIIEDICNSTDIVVLLSFCLARHAIDKDMGVGVHQDATAVSPEIPLSIWIPLNEVTPMRNSGLGFMVPAPNHVLPTMLGAGNDIGRHYVLKNLNNAWVPQYLPGDFSIHTKLSPHFTTGYGTLTDRYSLEIRVGARDEIPAKYHDPAIYISRRNGFPVVIGTKCSQDVGAHGFLAASALLVMQAAPFAHPSAVSRRSTGRASAGS